MPSKVRSKIWLMSTEGFARVVARNTSMLSLQKDLGYAGTSGYVTTMLKARIKRDGISTDHFNAHNRSTRPQWKIPIESILVENSSYLDRQRLIGRLVTNNLMKHECAVCGLPPLWNGTKLTLQLDHINGIPNDNRLNNLRILCPNCHSQTPSFCGRKHKPRQLKEATCNFCGRKFSRAHLGKGMYCSKRCAAKACRTEGKPVKTELRRLIFKHPATTIAKQFGVSSRAIAKWCLEYGITPPGRGYWSKVRAKENCRHSSNGRAPIS